MRGSALMRGSAIDGWFSVQTKPAERKSLRFSRVRRSAVSESVWRRPPEAAKKGIFAKEESRRG
jgi:hypothetical protein